MSSRERITAPGRWIVKIGSSLLTDHHSGLNTSLVQSWVDQIVTLKTQGVETLVVSSGAIVAGMRRLGWTRRPHELYRLQVAAAIGQMGLTQLYESAFQHHSVLTAQVLLTNADLANRQRYLNARSTLRALLDLNIVPVVNENDTVVTDEIRFGDNDTLAALVANLVEADVLVLLTDQQGLFDADPRQKTDANIIREARAGDKTLMRAAGPGSALGRGGMVTKLEAAEKAARSGTLTVIADGGLDGVLGRLHQGEEIGTLLIPGSSRLGARKQWLAGQLQASGELRLDAGAVTVLQADGRSLLAVGVTDVVGRFGRGELVVCVDPDGEPVARGLVNYSAEETREIMGKPSAQIESILGYLDEPELIHRDNMVLL